MSDDRQNEEAFLGKGVTNIAALRSATSPQAVEATLSRISAGMMQDAIERRARASAAFSLLTAKAD